MPTRQRNTNPRSRGQSSRSGTRSCAKATLIVFVEYSNNTGLDGIRVRIKGTNLEQTTQGGSVTFGDAPLGSQTVVIDEGDLDRAHARVPSVTEIPVRLTSGAVETVRFVVHPRTLKLIKVDKQFASSKESLTVTYDIHAMADKTVTMQIVGYGNQLLHKLTLSSSQKKNGTGKTLKWTGEITEGLEAGRYACPLDGPFKVKLLSPGWDPQQKRFDIRYASLALEVAPWEELYRAHTKRTDLDAPTEDTEAMRAWVAYKLNALGFWAGPPDGTDNEHLKRAIQRFRLAHPKLCGFDQGQTFYSRTIVPKQGKEMELGAVDLTTIDKALQTQLEASSTAGIVKRDALSNPAAIGDDGKSTKIFVDNSRFYISEHTEFGGGRNPETKYAVEQKWLSRPHVPIRCVATLVDKKGKPKRAPEGVGRVPVLWSWQDVPEADLRAEGLAPALPAYQPDAPSRVGDYIAQTQTKTQPGTRHGVAKAFGGILDGTHADALAPLVASAALHHATVAKNTVGVLTRGSQASDRPDVQGTPVLYLCPSNIAGDSYRVKAALHLADEPNHVDLEPLHTEVEAVSSGLMAVWRRIRIAGYVAWPKRANFSLKSEMAKVKKEFEPCLVELDTSAIEQFEAQQVFNDTTFGEVLDDAKIGDKETDDYLDAVKSRKFSKKSVYPGNPEEFAITFDKLVNQLIPKDTQFARTLAAAWQAHGQDNDVKEAGKHLVSALPVDPLAPVKQSTAKINATQVEELLLPKPIRDELEAYADGRSLDASQTSALQGHLRSLNLKEWGAERLVVDLLGEHLQKVVSRKSFKDDVVPLFRADPLDLRKWSIRRRVGRLAGNINARLAEKTDLLVRKQLATKGKACDGAILLDYATSEAATIRNEPFIVDGVAFGGLNGVALMDQGLKSAFYSLAAHELGHCMFLLHWKNAPSSVAGNHDQADDNCLMSYPVYYTMNECSESDRAAFLERQYRGSEHSTKAHYCHDNFEPHFCGKCNLQIRGWKLTGDEPAAAPPRVAVEPKVEVSVKLVRDKVASDQQSAEWGALDVTRVGVSFYPPHKAGAQQAGMSQFKIDKLDGFPRTFGDSLPAALDPGAFRVEIHDPNREAKVVYATLEALRPTYSNGIVDGWTEFSGKEREKRALVEVECAPLANDPNTYRSRYIRLVVDEYDHQALAGTKQGLLVTDMVTATSDPEQDEVEILDQKIRVWYDPS